MSRSLWYTGELNRRNENNNYNKKQKRKATNWITSKIDLIIKIRTNKHMRIFTMQHTCVRVFSNGPIFTTSNWWQQQQQPPATTVLMLPLQPNKLTFASLLMPVFVVLVRVSTYGWLDGMNDHNDCRLFYGFFFSFFLLLFVAAAVAIVTVVAVAVVCLICVFVLISFKFFSKHITA